MRLVLPFKTLMVLFLMTIANSLTFGQVGTRSYVTPLQMEIVDPTYAEMRVYVSTINQLTTRAYFYIDTDPNLNNLTLVQGQSIIIGNNQLLYQVRLYNLTPNTTYYLMSYLDEASEGDEYRFTNFTTLPNCAAGAASSSPTVCINNALTNITHTTTGVTGIADDGISGANGLPPGVSATWASDLITISGTPTVAGPFTYSIPLIGGCGNVSATGTITVNALPTIGTYTNTTIITGKNLTITPGSAPANASNMVAFTNNNFSGLLSVDPTTGVLTVTNAKQEGTYPVTALANSNGGCSARTSFTLTVTKPACSQGLFSGTNDTIANVLIGVAVGDFNGDGKQDIATTNSTVSIRLGDGIGGYNATTNVAVGQDPFGVAVGDFNGDGKQDLVTANRFPSTISIRLGDGIGGFSGTTDIPVGVAPTYVAVGDFNGDGKQDIAVGGTARDNVYICIGDGLGGFNAAFSVAVGYSPISCTVADFNNDGKQDIATANSRSSNASILLGDGLGGFFSRTTDLVAGNFPSSIAVGDFNGDGNQDIAVANNSSSGSVSIRLGDGLGGFSGTTEVSVGPNPYKVVVGDFNGDGKQDIATANSAFFSTFSIRLGDGLGGFSGNSNELAGTRTNNMAVGDFNGDGKLDIVLTSAGNLFSPIPYIVGGIISIRLGGEALINLQGNNTNIANGSTNPSTAAATDFGVTCNGGSGVTQTYTIQNTGTTALTVNDINLSGADVSMFLVGGITLPVTIAGNSSATFTVTFTPTSTGVKSAQITITNNSCGIPSYTYAISALVTDASTASAASSSPAICVNSALTNITHTTTGASGIANDGVSGASGLPGGVSATWANDQVTISGTPTAAGTFNYSIPLTGGCGTVSATGTITVNSCAPATALNFDGVNDQVVSASAIQITGTAARTVEFWAKMDANAPAFQHLFNWGTVNTTGRSFGLFSSSRALFFYGWGSSIDFNANYTIDNQWHHYAVTYSGRIVSVYVDGNLTASQNRTLSTVATRNYIGTRQDGTAPFSGSIDEFRIWRRALCQGEIQNNINGELAAGQIGLVLYYKLNSGLINTDNAGLVTATDASGNNNNGTLNNFALTGATSNWVAGTVTGTASSFIGPSVTITSSGNTTFCVGSSVDLMTNTANTTSPAYQWYKDNAIINGATTASYTATTSGSYTVSITSIGCSATSPATTVTALINTAAAASSSPIVCINTAITNITHTTTGATGIGTATGLPTGVSASFATNTITISGIPTVAGTFNYNIPLTGGCGTVSATGTITVTENNTVSAASSTPTVCPNTAIPDITHTTTGATGISDDGVSGANGLPAGVSATWSNDQITISGAPTASGTFNYNIPLIGGCNVSATGTITVIANTTSDISATACNSYTWNGTIYKATGDYVWHTTNKAGCDSAITLHLTITTVTSNVNKTDALCYAGSSGSITVNPTFGATPFTYRIGTVASYVTTNVFSNLKAGKYTISILDANGCAGITSQVTIDQPPVQAGTATTTPVLCNGGSTGSITVTPTNGVAPYTYRYGSTGSYVSSNVFTNIKGGTPRIFIQDANGCIGSVVATVSQPDKMAATATVVNETCPNAKNGSITINPTGGTSPYSYRYGTTGAFGASNTFSNLKAGSYRIYVNDANGCSGYSIATTVGQTSPTCIVSTFARGAVNSTVSEGITLSPNPTNNQFKLMLPSTDKVVTVRVLDVNGKTLFTTKTGNQSITFGENFAPGVYMVEVRKGETVKTLKAVKVR